MTTFGTIAELWRYPVSSLGGERLQAAELDLDGLRGDRLWGVVDPEAGEVAQPERRKRWRPAPELKSRLNGAGVEITRDGAEWLPIGSAAAAALASAHLGFPVELRPHTPFETEAPDKVAPRYGRAPLHVLTSASLRQLEALLPESARIDARRFRPNLVIETASDFEGFVEAELVGRTLEVGAAQIVVSEPCKRCAFTTLAQDDLPLDPLVLHAIAQEGSGNFGVLCRVDATAPLKVGDEVRLVG